MKLQRQIALRYKDKARYKHVSVISNKTIKKLGWKAEEEFENHVNGKTLMIKSKK